MSDDIEEFINAVNIDSDLEDIDQADDFAEIDEAQMQESMTIRAAYDRMLSRLHNRELEYEVLGHIINNPSAQIETLTNLKTDHFNDPTASRIFGVLLEMFAQKSDIDQIGVSGFIDLKVKGMYIKQTQEGLRQACGTCLTDTLFNSTTRLKEMLKNRLIYTEVLQNGGKMFDDNVPTEEIIEHMLNVLINVDSSKPEKSTEKVAANVVDEILNPSMVSGGLKCGLQELDAVIGGFRKDRYVTIGQASGGGKTALAVALIDELCQRYPEEIEVLFLSMEMSEDRIVKRFISKHTGLSVGRLESRISNLSKEERAAVKEAGDKIAKYPMQILYQVMTPNQIKLRVRKFAMQNPGKHLFVVADHIGLVSGVGNDMRVNTIQASSAFKSCCVEYDCTTIVLTQFTKESEGTENKKNFYRPHMRYIMESGRIRQDSDIVLLGWRPEVWFPTIPLGDDMEWKTEGKIILMSEKNRDGQAPCDMIFNCDISTNRFSNEGQML